MIALSLVVLLLAVALGGDWGYSLTQRRVMQNAADSGALAGARLLATSVIGQKQGNNTVPVYATYEEAVYCRAMIVADSQRSFRPVGSTPTFLVQITSDVTVTDPYSSPYGKTLTAPVAGCATAPTTGTVVASSIRFVRVVSTMQFRGILAAASGANQITASASAVARVTGTPVPASGKTWPMLRHYNPADFAATCQLSQNCTPESATPITFWDSNDPDMVYNDFMGLLDVSRYSPNILKNAPSGTVCTGSPATSATCVPQLIDHWDDSGDRFGGSGGAANRFGGNACAPPAPTGKWYTDGDENPQQYDKVCSIQNWFYALFQGKLSLTNNHDAITWNGTTEFREAPNNGAALASNRSSCQSQVPGLSYPSCGAGNGGLGDWVEAAHTGNVGNSISTPLQAYIDDFGVGCVDSNGNPDPSDVFCNRPTSNGNGAPLYGKHVVILVYLWDCAETFRPGNAPGDQWALTRPKTGTDCSSIHQGNDMDSQDSVDRVHLVTVAPFTFYRGLVDSNSIKGYWGGLVADPTVCQQNPSAPGCTSLGIFSNGVFLVADR